MTLKPEVAELRYEVVELSSGELRLTFTTEVKVYKNYAKFLGHPDVIPA